MIFNDAVGRGQAEAGPFTHVLGRKKGFKNSFDDILVDSDTRIRDRYFYVLSPRDLEWSAVFIAEVNIFGLNVNFAAIGHGMPGIEVKI